MSLFASTQSSNNRMNQLHDALFGNNRTNKANKSSVSLSRQSPIRLSDQLMLSPKTHARSIISEFKQSSASSLNISLNVKANPKLSGDANMQRIMNSAEKLLRLISRSDEEYQELSSSFKKLFDEQASNTPEGPSPEELSNMGLEYNKTTSEVKYSSYELTMSFGNQANKEASESKSIAKSFTNALASFFGYSSKTEIKTEINKESNVEVAKSAQGAIESKVQNKDLEKVLEASRMQRSSSYQRLQELKLKGCDPIVLDLSGEGLNLTEAGKGAHFDINADGNMDSSAWVSGNTALLVYDKNGNNIIDNGSELFGDQNGAKDGFKELAKYDDDKDNKITNKDQIYKNLKLYRDLNGDGLMSENEFSTLEEMGIKALNLNCREVDEEVNGNAIVLSGSFEREDGTKGTMADAIFGYSELD